MTKPFRHSLQCQHAPRDKIDTVLQYSLPEQLVPFLTLGLHSYTSAEDITVQHDGTHDHLLTIIVQSQHLQKVKLHTSIIVKLLTGRTFKCEVVKWAWI